MAETALRSVKKQLRFTIRYAINPDKTTLQALTKERRSFLKEVLSYDPEDDRNEQACFVRGINCDPYRAYDQFQTVKKEFFQTDGIQGFHGYMSFAEDEVTPGKALAVGLEFARRVWGNRFQVVLAVHMNTGHLHCHFVINSVSYLDGGRMKNEERNWLYFHQQADQVCREFGLSVIEDPVFYQRSYRQVILDREGAPTSFNLARSAIDRAIRESGSYPEFSYVLQKLGYSIGPGPGGRYQAIWQNAVGIPIPLKKLGAAYAPEQILQRLEHIPEPPDPSISARRHWYDEYLAGDPNGKTRTLQSLYESYRFLLGYNGAFCTQPDPLQLHPLVRNDLLYIERITEEYDYLRRQEIHSLPSLSARRQLTEQKIEQLKKERLPLYQEKQRRSAPETPSSAAEQLQQLNDRLKALRKDLRICDRILKRVPAMQEKIQKLIWEAEKNRDYERKV